MIGSSRPLRCVVTVRPQQFVGGLLLVEDLTQDILGIVEAKLVGERRCRTVRGDLVVLDALRGGDQRGILGHRLP